MNDGAQILTGLAQTRNFFRQISLMLRTADDMLVEEGWLSNWGTRSSNITSNYLRPDNWMPRDIYRFYIAGDEEESGDNRLVIYVGVLLDQEDAWDGFVEPWITCGVFKMIPKFGVKDFNYWEWVRAIFDDNYEPDGEFHEYITSESEIEEGWDLLYQAVMALPLVYITDSESLKTKILDPLLKQIEEMPDLKE